MLCDNSMSQTQFFVLFIIEGVVSILQVLFGFQLAHDGQVRSSTEAYLISSWGTPLGTSWELVRVSHHDLLTGDTLRGFGSCTTTHAVLVTADISTAYTTGTASWTFCNTKKTH